MTEAGSYDFTLRGHELGADGHATLPALCNLLQEAAGLHAHHLGVSIEQLQAARRTWFLGRLTVRIATLPRWRQRLTVETWPAALDRLYAVRDFRLTVGGEEVARASSSWLLIDLDRGRPLRSLPPELVRLHPDPPRRVLSEPPVRLPALRSWQREERFAVRAADLDGNGHVNHVVYISHLTEPGVGPGDPWRPVALDLDFRAEARLGDDIVVRTEEGDDGARRHTLVRDSDGQELVRGRTVWRVPEAP